MVVCIVVDMFNAIAILTSNVTVSDIVIGDVVSVSDTLIVIVIAIDIAIVSVSMVYWYGWCYCCC